MKSSLVLNWVIPPPFPGSGGHANIFRAMRFLAEFGHTNNLYTWPSDETATARDLRKIVDTYFHDIHAAEYSVDLFQLGHAEGDAVIATHYRTVYPAVENRGIPLKLYFMQDFKPLTVTEALGGDFIIAENTYKMGLRGICSGPWCAQLIRERYGMECHYFMFPVNRQIYYPRPVERKKRLLFFARPDYPRRCYGLGICSLAIFNKMMPDVEIVLYGSMLIDSNAVPFPHVNSGLLETKDQLAELYSSARGGLVFSTTNPSLVPLEMMACRCAVVDLNYNDNSVNYGSEGNAVLTGTMPEEIADGLARIFKDDNLRRRTVDNAYNFVTRFPGEVEMARRIESLIYYYLLNDRRGRRKE